MLISSPGGSGTFIHLVAVRNDAGAPAPIASIQLGDRVAVRSIRIEDRKIMVGMRVRGASDPFALLTREVTRFYLLQNDQLILESEQTQDVPSAPPAQFSYDPQRLALDVGRTAAQQGTLRPGELATFLVAGAAGQELRVTARSQFSNAILSIQGVDDMAQLVSRTAYANVWSGTLSSSQDYAITVISLAGNDLNYELTVELRAAPDPVPTPARPNTPPSSARPRPAIPAPLTGQFRPPLQTLGALSTDAATFLESRIPTWGAAVASTREAVLYSQNGDVQLELASVVKVLVALAVMDAAQREQRYVDRFELSLLWPMITISDNDSTTKLWDQLGGGRAVAGYLFTIGATDIKPYDGPYWGTSTASANSLALVVARAAFGDLLNAEHRALFLDLLQKVTPSQRWGVSAGVEGGERTGEGIVGLKDGWYPAEAGWRVNSVGFVVSNDAQQYYTIAVLTNGQPSRAYGIDTIEGVAIEVSNSLLE